MFFTAIHQMMTESVDLTIVIRKANGQLTVSTLPKSNGLKDEAQNHIVPLTVTGTPQELDTGFLQADSRQESPGSRQRAYAGKSTRECRPTERNRRKNKDCHFRNEQG